MTDEAKAALARRDLDGILNKWRRVPAVVPKRGWIHELRTALGMTAGDLAFRMRLSQAGVASMEISEAKATIQLETLRRAAKALDCTLVYALVPKMQLEKIVERRRRHLAVGDLGAVLYNVPGKEYKDLVTAYAQTIKRSRIWRERY